MAAVRVSLTAMQDQDAATPSQAYDERPARARGSYGFDIPQPTSAPESPAAIAYVAPLQPDMGSAPPGFLAGLPTPDPLSAEDAKDGEELAGLVGEYAMAAFYSRSWQLREASLQCLAHRLQEQV